MELKRCPWCESEVLLREYHDTEWGARQLHDDRGQFEFLTLETMQCGLSWLTVLRRREAMRVSFDGFEPAIIAGYDEEKLNALMEAPGIIHCAGKLRAMVNNARCFLNIAAEYGSFDAWFWSFTEGKTLIYPENAERMPAQNALSEMISAGLKKRGFKYLGPVVVYSHMQAVGMINDHSPECFLRGKLGGEISDAKSNGGK